MSLTDLTFQDPKGLVNREAFNERFAMLNQLMFGLGNQYLWNAIKKEINYSGKYEVTSFFSSSSTSETRTAVYADSIEDLVNNRNVKTVQVSYNTYTNANVLIGKYFYGLEPSERDLDVWYIKPGTTLSTSQFQFFYYINCEPLCVQYRDVKNEIVENFFVNSENPTTYPPTEPDGYTYTLLGQFGNKVQIEIGYYTGTGTYGEDHPTRLTFSFQPKFLAIQDSAYSDADTLKENAGSLNINFWALEHTWGRKDFRLGNADKAKWIDENTLEWYSTSSSNNQYNYTHGYIYVIIR